ncbi:uncharacterized protein PAC_10278 [Phialocephala subalpina]|uniref:DUF7580 domain-containing protein n=1 Tax=Phialocephala subalpina TaxID=576137 RepID=A0A1L7X5T6_9HELO|nr:uncharacterized protein PAC_10278 [Phialocephala subalpina]
MAELAALGLVLGVLPLIVSAIEDYENVCRPVRHYKNFALESVKVQQKLSVEKAIFIAECKLLLQATLSASLAGQMVADVKHAAWTDKELNDTLTEYMAGYEGHFSKVVEDIRKEVVEIETLCQAYGILDKEVTNKSQEKLHELESQRHLFVEISSQIRESIKLSTAHATLRRKEGVGSAKTCEYQTIQEASKELYEALSKACDCHDEHSLHVRLDTHRPLKASGIRFNLGLHSAEYESPTWIVIESMSKSISIEQKYSSRTSSAQFPASNPNLPNLFGTQNIQQRSIHVERVSRVRIQRSSGWQCPLWSEDIKFEATQNIESSPLDLSTHRKICHQLRQQVEEKISTSEDEKCLGFLESDSKYRHHLYFTPEQLSTPRSDPMSLSHLISPGVRQSPLGDLNLYEKFRLARQLSEAVLHYHPTPVMRRPWQSEDNSDRNSDEDAFSPRNPHLFALALLLFEIGYQTSIEDLHVQFRSSGSHSSNQRHYNLIRKVCKNFMSAKTGIPYKVIVYKCLNCDFGTGEDDLSSANLQRAFYEHVVCVLEQLEREQGEIYGAELS